MKTSQVLTEPAARDAERLAAKLHVDRTAALAAAKLAINEAADRDLTSLRKQIGACEDSRTAQLEAAAQAVERTRRARAAALVAEIFAPGPDSLASQAARFRVGPNRALALAIRATWDRFAERAQAEIGEELSSSVLEAVFIDDICSAPGLAGAISHLSTGNGSIVVDALGRATRPYATPQDILDALVQVEDELLRAAHQHRGIAAEPDHVAMHALRRAHCTRRDLMDARDELGQQQGARRQAEFVRTYQPPPSLSDAIRGSLVGRGLLPAQ